MNLKYRIIKFLARRWDFLLVVHEPDHQGAVMYQVEDEERAEHVIAILASCMSEKDEVKALILGATAQHFDRYEIDGNNFLQEVFNIKR